jgi:hypothetical protein
MIRNLSNLISSDMVGVNTAEIAISDHLNEQTSMFDDGDDSMTNERKHTVLMRYTQKDTSWKESLEDLGDERLQNGDYMVQGS